MPAPLIIAGLAAAGFVKGGGLGGIVGSGRRKREQQAAQVEQRERQYDYENFDYNQDVGDVYNPYAQVASQQQEFEQENIDRAQARTLQQHEQAGTFGAATGIQSQSQDAARQAAQRVSGIRAQGAQYVEQQRQARIQQRYGQAETFLARADNRLAQANQARQRATEKIYKGIGAGVTAAAGGIAGGGGLGALKSGTFSAGGALKGSGLLPELPGSGGSTGGGADFSQFLGGSANTDLGGTGQLNFTGTAGVATGNYSQYADPITGEFNEYGGNLGGN